MTLLSKLAIGIDEAKIITIQKLFRGNSIRKRRLPLIMYEIQKIMELCNFTFTTVSNDGRENSCGDECKVIKVLRDVLGTKIKVPKHRHWFDIQVFDNIYGWLPVNIKTTTTKTTDNTGNFAMCVYAYTDEKLDLDKTYKNGKMSDILFNKLKNKEYNTDDKKDYYFLILNKENPGDVIVNSVKGLTILTPNINNLPFQVCWNRNRIFKYKNINENIKQILECLQKPKPSWQETFMSNIRTINW